MICLEAAQTLRGIASAATSVSYSIFGMELVGGVESYKVLAQGQLGASVGTLYTVPASTQAFIKSLHLINLSASLRTFKLFVGGAVAANQITGQMNLQGNCGASFDEMGWKFYDSSGRQRMKSVL